MVELEVRIVVDDAMGLEMDQSTTLREIMKRAGSDLDATVIGIRPHLKAGQVAVMKRVRERSSAGLLYAKRELEACGWDAEEAIRRLRKLGFV